MPFRHQQQAVRLVRTVEMHQWKEKEKSETTTKAGGSEETITTYSYAKGWDSEAIISGSFKKPDGQEPTDGNHGKQAADPGGQAWRLHAGPAGAGPDSGGERDWRSVRRARG